MKMLPVLAAGCRRRKLPVGKSWRIDETYVKGGGPWKYLYRAVDNGGDTIDFLLRAKRDHTAARAFFDEPSNYASRSTSTTSSSKTTGPSNESQGRCSDSRPFAAPES